MWLIQSQNMIFRDFSEIKRIIANVGNCSQPFDIAQFPLAVCISPSSKAVACLLIESAVAFDDPRGSWARPINEIIGPHGSTKFKEGFTTRLLLCRLIRRAENGLKGLDCLTPGTSLRPHHHPGACLYEGPSR
jgi:hypothetical protein